jgi:hypothetical protein
MVAISLPVIVAYSLVLSGALVWTNKFGRGALANALVTLAPCVAIGLIHLLASRSAPASFPFFSAWALSVLVPSIGVFAVSVLPVARARPWSLMLLGPVSFLVGMIVSVTLFNILFGSGRSQ